MNLGITVLGIAARLARWRIARARQQAVEAALLNLAAQRRQQADGQTDSGTTPSNTTGQNNKTRS